MNLRVFGVHSVIELAPVLYTVDKLSGGRQEVEYGGVAHLIDAGHLIQAQAGMPGVIDREVPLEHGTGGADLATNAETQTLRLSVDRPDIRMILTVAEGLYRIVARRSAGIASVRDLAGKRVGTFPRTSASFYLHKELVNAGLSEDDVELVFMAPAAEIARAMIAGEVDAIAIWEPAAQDAFDALGADAIELRTPGLYREMFSLHTTTEKLDDPHKRAEIVTFVRALIDACRHITESPEDVWPLSARTTKLELESIKASWHHHRWIATMPDDLLDVLVDEEPWIAAEQNRQPRSREMLAPLIDGSIFREAIAGSAKQGALK